MELTRWQSGVISFAAGAMMALAFAPFNGWPIIFISLPLFYWLLSPTHAPIPMPAITRGETIWRGFFYGYGQAMAGTWWIANSLLVDGDRFAWMIPFSVLGLSAIMAVWFVLFAWLVWRLRAHMSPLLFALLWVMVEYLRSLGLFGFPWNLAGYISLVSLPLAQIASWVGVYGLSVWVVLVGLIPVMLTLKHHSIQLRMAMVVLLIVMIGGFYGWGMQRLRAPTQDSATIIRLVQPNVPQAIKGTRAGQRMAMEALGRLSTQPGRSHQPDVVIWPETAYPQTVRDTHTLSIPTLPLLITGAVRAEGPRAAIRIFNSVLAVNANGDILATYDKHQLVPFGEFVPLRHWLPLDKITPGAIDFSRGSGPQSLIIKGIPSFSPLVCYEVIFPWMAVAKEGARPAWLLNLTNDGWFGDSPGPHQHLAMVRMRAIEQGLPLVRVANSGVSALVDPYGRIRAQIDLNIQDVRDVVLPAPVEETFYAQHGTRVIIFITILFFIILMIRSYYKK